MKMKLVDSNSKKPLANTRMQLQIKGKNSGFLTLTTDPKGEFTLDDKYKNQQMTASVNGMQSQWTTISEDATIQIASRQSVMEKMK